MQYGVYVSCSLPHNTQHITHLHSWSCFHVLRCTYAILYKCAVLYSIVGVTPCAVIFSLRTSTKLCYRTYQRDRAHCTVMYVRFLYLGFDRGSFSLLYAWHEATTQSNTHTDTHSLALFKSHQWIWISLILQCNFYSVMKIPSYKISSYSHLLEDTKM